MYSRKITITAFVTCIVAVLILVSFQIQSSREEALLRAETTSQNYASMLEARLDATLRRAQAHIQQVERSLPLLAMDKAASPRFSEAIAGDLEAARIYFPELRAIRVWDANGALLYTSGTHPTIDVNGATREYFSRARDAINDAFHFSTTTRSDITEQPTLYVARAIRNQENTFIGVVSASIDLDFFQSLYRSLDLGDYGAIAIFRSDSFAQIVRWPPKPDTVDAVKPPNNITRRALENGIREGTTRAKSYIDGESRIVSFRALNGYPFYVAVGISERDALAGWTARATIVSMATLVLLAAFIGMAYHVFAAERKLQTVNADLEARVAHRTTELQAAQISAEDANQAKSRFLANMTHELRTPLHAITGMLELLSRTQLSVQQRDYIQKTGSAARSLLKIINSVLDLSKIDAGKMTLDKQPFSVRSLLGDVEAIVTANVRDKPIQLHVLLDERIPEYLIADSTRLQQVLVNLTGNAIKFTPRGKVSIELCLIEQGTGQDTTKVKIRFAVRDTGIGIAPDKLAQIFDDFEQAEASTNRHFGGTGLGLSISRSLVELMGGALRVESEPGRGSLFEFELPLLIAPSQNRAPQVGQVITAAVPIHTLYAGVVGNANMPLSNTHLWVRRMQSHAEDTPSTANATASTAFAEVSETEFNTASKETSQAKPQEIFQETSRVISHATSHATSHVTSQAASNVAAMRDMTLASPFPVISLATRTTRLLGMRILVAEDDQLNQFIARELLEDEGATVSIVANGFDAVEAVRRADPPFDAVLMDIQMPEQDGYAATRTIRNTLGMHALPIIAMTANAMTSDQEACLAAGMNDHIGKPIPVDYLVKLLARVGQVRSGQARVPA